MAGKEQRAETIIFERKKMHLFPRPSPQFRRLLGQPQSDIFLGIFHLVWCLPSRCPVVPEKDYKDNSLLYGFVLAMWS